MLNNRIGLLTFLSGSALLSIANANAISYPDFSSAAGLTLNGSANIQGNTLQLTPSAGGQSGSAFSTSTIELNHLSSFSTRFAFQLDDPAGIGDGDGVGADGIVFVVQTVSNNVGGAGGGLGYAGISPSVGVEFDTYNNGEPSGGNHVGIDLNGSVNSVVSVPEAKRFNDGDIFTAWVDYNGATGKLEVRYNLTGIRPNDPALSADVNLGTLLGTPNAFVGFTAGTGSGFGDQRILNWEFVADFKPIGGTNDVPDTGSSLLLLGMSSLLLFRTARSRA